MRTLIERFDERPLENMLATEMFRPERTIFVCSREAAENRTLKRKMRAYLDHRGIATELIFRRVGLYNAAEILQTLRSITEEYPDCVLDITGGTDDALFAAGELCAENRTVPVFTYSRRKNRFYSIHNASFAEGLACTVQYDVEDFILMAGGALHQGRVDNSILADYMDCIEPFFRIYLKHRREWVKGVDYLQQISRPPAENVIPLRVEGSFDQKGERGSRIQAPVSLLEDFEKIGFLKDLKIKDGEKVGFTFADPQIRMWMRDVGSVLELYVYKTCLETGVFDDVMTSAVVDWEGEEGRVGVTNEIDVVATRGVIPVFISCKTSEVKTEALNELSILRDRFGGEMAKAVLVTTRSTAAITRRRAMELKIDILDLKDITSSAFRTRIARLI